jgi:hypothetical protein
LDISLTGKYEFSITEGVIEKMERELTVDVTWTFDDMKKNDKRKFRLNKNLVNSLHRTLVSSQERVGNVVGYTRVVITTSLTKERTIFYAHPCFQGMEWYDWAMVHFKEQDNFENEIENYYPLMLLGFVSIKGKHEAIIQCLLKPLSWDHLQETFIVEIELGTNFDVSFVTVPVNSIVHPLCVFPDGEKLNRYYVVLPKRNWSHFFGNNINRM